MPTFITDDELLEAVAIRLSTDSNNLLTTNPSWRRIVRDANESAYNSILSQILSRSPMTMDLLNTWPRRQEFNRRIGLCRALTEAALMKMVDMEAVREICKCEKELATVPIVIDGVQIQTTDDDPNVVYGEMEYDTTTVDRNDLPWML